MDNNGYERLNPNPKPKKNLSESRSPSQPDSTISQGLYAQVDEPILVSNRATFLKVTKLKVEMNFGVTF